MATPPTTGHSGASDVSAQIERITEQLIQLCLLEVSKKYHLPKLKIGFPKIPQSLDGAIDTKYYTVKITCDLTHAHAKWELKREAIEERIEEIEKPDFVSGMLQKIIGNTGATNKKRETSWGFYGFISEKSFLLEDVKEAKDISNNARFSSKVNGQLSIELEGGIPHPTLFLVMFDHATQLVVEEDERTVVQLPQKPTLEDISKLQAQLNQLTRHLSDKPKGSRPPESSKTQIFRREKECSELKKELEALGCSETEIEDALTDYRETLDRTIFSHLK